MSRDETNPNATPDVATVANATPAAEMKAGVDGSAKTLDIFKFFEKPEGGDDLAVFGLTRTNVEQRRRSNRVL